MDNDNLDGTKRSHIQIGQWVEIVEKHNQASGETTEGQVRRILTKSGQHPHGIKVKLTTGEVGRVKEILEDWAKEFLIFDSAIFDLFILSV